MPTLAGAPQVRAAPIRSDLVWATLAWSGPQG